MASRARSRIKSEGGVIRGKATRPAPVLTGNEPREFDLGRIGSEANSSHRFLQVLHLTARFGLTLPHAETIARLAFCEARP